jgi:putative tryptophan/tyrosine transport system substrate-binding protein
MFWLEQIELSDEFGIQNRKSKIQNRGDSAKCFSKGGSGNQMIKSREQWARMWEDLMKRPFLSFALCATVLVFGLPAQAQKQAMIPRIGILVAGAPSKGGASAAFVQGLQALGYVDGKNILFEIRYAEGNRERLRDLALELVQLKVDAIYTGSSPAIFALKQATKTIPVVIVSSTDPVRSGIVASLASPGGNITGISLIANDLWPKRLQLIKEILPKVSRVAIFWNKSNTGMAAEAKATEEAAGLLGVTLHDRGVKDASEIDVAFEAMKKERPDAFLALMDVPLRAHRKRILEFLAKQRVPAIFESKDWVEAGGLISYGAESAEVRRRAAIQMDKILKGIKPADIPVEQPTKFEFVINLKTAKQIGLTLPQTVLMRADKVIR